MVYLRRKVEVPTGLGVARGYWLVLREEVLVTDCPDGNKFVTEYDVCEKLKDARYAERVGREFGKALILAPERDENGRYDFRVRHGSQQGRR